MGFAFGLMFLVGGGWILVRWNRAAMRLERYEFENTTDGGVVQFKTFEDSKRHASKKVRLRGLANVGCFLVAIGVLVILGAWLLPG